MKKKISIVLVLGLTSLTLAAEDTWTAKSPMPTARYVLSSSVVDGKIYAIGGTPNGTITIPTVEAYDPVTDTWTKKADMPMVNGAAASSVVNGRIYVIGGGHSLWGTTYSSVIEYDVTTDTWIPKADMPTARGWVSSSVVNGKIYVIGGASRYQSAALSTVEEYDPATDTWTSKADMPTARACLSTSVVNGKIYAIGGCPGHKRWYEARTTVEEYDPVTDTWRRKAFMPTPRTYISICALNGRIYAFGGLRARADHVAPIEEYDPTTDTWTTKADMSAARSGVATSSVNDKIYVIGGWRGTSAVLTTVEEFDPYPLNVDFNGDFKIDIEDLIMLVEFWGTDDSLCDIFPRPFGDGIVDRADLEVLMDHWGQEINDPTLIAHWALDETEGNIAYDSAGELDGSVYGEPLWQTRAGMVGGALEFDGINDYVNIPGFYSPANSSLSVFAWIKGGAPGQVIFSHANRSDWLGADAADGSLKTELKFLGKSSKTLSSQTIITDDQWHRVGLVWNGINRILYVDDVEVASDTYDAGIIIDDLQIGAGNKLEAGTFWSGLIDDVRIYNRAVNP